MNRLKAGWPKGKKKSSKGAPSSLASYGPGAPPLQFQRSSQALPPLIEDCLAWLEAHRVWEVEGIFRISGDFHEIKALLRKYAKGKKVKLDDETTGLRAHTVACLFKTYLRELPIPLLTFELYKPFLSAIGVPDEKARLELIRTTMAILPPANKALLTRLLALMRKVADHADTNKMHAQNLAIVFAPCLLRPENDDLMAALMDGGVSQALLSTMVTHYSYFFIEKGDKSETAKQLTGEYKDFYRTLRKGTLRLAASMVEEKKLLQRLKEGEDFQSEGEVGGENGGAAGGDGGDGGDVEGGLASMSSEVRRFAAKVEPRRRAATTATTPEVAAAAAAVQGKPLPAPPRPARPPPVTKLLPAPDAQPLRSQPPIPHPAAAAAKHDDDHLSPREPQEPPQQPQHSPTPFEGEDHLKATAAKAEEPAVMDLKTTRKLPKRAGAKEGDGGDREEQEREKERERKAKQISMSWNPSHVRRELEASGGGAKGEQGRLLYAELEGSGKELLRSHSTQIASIRRRLKQSSAELASSSDSDSSGGDDDDEKKKKKNDDRTRAPSLCRSTPAAKVAPAASDSDSDHSTQRLSSSHRVRSVRSRLQSDSDSDSDSSASSSDEPNPAKRNENKQSRDDDDDDDASENSSGDEVKVVTTKQTTTYLTPEQMVKLVRQQRAQQRKELLAKKKNDKQQHQQQKKKKRGSGSDSDSSSSSEAGSSSASSSGSGSDSDEGDVRSKRKSPKAVSHRHPMGKSMPTRPSASPTPVRLAASLPSPHEERKERTPRGGSSSSSSSSEDEVDDAAVVLAWSEKMAEGDLGYFERLIDGGSNPMASADLAALAKDVDLVSLDHFQ